MAITYNTTLVDIGYIYTATGGGVTFSANRASSTAFDYFPNTAVTNDAIYFGKTTSVGQCWSDIVVNVGTAINAGVTGVLEYASGATSWATIPQLRDDTVGFTVTGVNRIRFGFPINWRSVAINSVTTTWVRYRITGGTVTEGGANQTSKVQIGDGRVNVTGYSVGAECTLTDIYNYMNTNYSYVGALKNSNYFDFRWFSISFDSPTVSYNEVLEIGFDINGTNNVRGNWNFDYWTTGVLVGTNHGRRGSKILINAVTNEYPLTFTVNQKSYGASYFSNPNRNAGYPNFGGTFYDCLLQLAPGAVGIGDMQNCTFEIGFGFIASSWATTLQNPFLNNKFIVMASSAWSVYSASFTITKPDITFDSGTKYLLGAQQNNVGGLIWNFVDSVTTLPTISTANKPMLSARAAPGNIPNVFFYDDSAGTYTDITTACADATTNDVSLNGDVNDCWYFNIQSAATSLAHPSVVMTGGANDYVYEWTYWKSGAWKQFSNQWDETLALTQSGVIWGERAMSDITVLTVNGVAGYWYRLRIVTKGTTTNTATQIRRIFRGGTADWKLNYQNSINYTARDGSGNALAGVEVTVCDNTGACQFTGTTGVLGTIAAGNVTTAQYRFDPLDAGRDTSNDTAEILYNPFVYTSRKYGYIPQVTTATISSPQIPVNVFLTNANVVASQTVAHAYTGITVDGTTNTITIDEDHTMQEVYDYCEDWFALTANMGYNEPFVTTDGQNFTSTYDLVLDNCALTGTGRISIVVNTVTYIGTATSTLDIVAVDGTHTNIKLTNLEAGSRIQLYNEDTTTELYNEVVAGTSLTFPIIWNVDTNIRIRVMHVATVTAKKWYETNATLTNTGINLAINQEDDTVYNDIAIDGSTVAECEIVGTVMKIEVTDADNQTTPQRIYAYEVAWLMTEAGIRDQELFVNAITDTVFEFLGGLLIKNMKLTTPLNINGGNIYPTTGLPTDVIDPTGGSININSNVVVGFPYAQNVHNYNNTLIGVGLRSGK